MMAYHPLANDSGGDVDSRVAEARSLLKMIEDHYEELSTREQDFIESMQERDCLNCSVKQLFWLRDIKDKL